MIGRFIDPNILCFSCTHGIICRKIDFPDKKCYLNQNLYKCSEYKEVSLIDELESLLNKQINKFEKES